MRSISQRSIALRGNPAGRCKSSRSFVALGGTFHYVLYMGQTQDFTITSSDGAATLVVRAGERQRPMWLPSSLCK